MQLCVVICSERAESSLFETLRTHRHIFEEHLFDSAQSRQELCGPREAPLLAVHTRSLHHTLGRRAVAVFPSGAESLPVEELFAVVVNSACACPEATGVPVIRCGLCSGDTLTFSSITEEQAVVSLQQNLHTLSGQIVEPQEIPIRLGGKRTPFDILALCALLLLADKGGSIGQFVF